MRRISRRWRLLRGCCFPRCRSSLPLPRSISLEMDSATLPIRMVPDSSPLLDVRDLRVHFMLDEGVVRAVDGLTYSIRRGRTLGIVGESRCGKTVTAQAILRIVPRPGRITG